jgi:hypothetical protein
MLGGSAWAASGLQGDFDGWISANHQPIDFSFLVSSENTPVELLFGTCNDSSEVNLPLQIGTPTDPDEIPFDLYFFQDPNAYNIFFTENGHDAEWNLFVKTGCTLKFTLLDGDVPGEGGSLELLNDKDEPSAIFRNAVITLVAGQYTIKYVPAPEKSDEPAEVEYTFHPGWNLLHFPIVVYDKEENSGWKSLNGLPRMTLSGRTYVKGGDIRCGEAFWVFYDGSDSYSLTVLGYEPLPGDWPVPQNGWNFTGGKADIKNPTAIYEWNATYQHTTITLDPDDPDNRGYWINKP